MIKRHLPLFLFFSAIYTVSQTQNFIEYFVASNGLDSQQCGNLTYPCGTLYQTSILINTQQLSNEEYNITVINGQNLNEIIKYHTFNINNINNTNNTNKYNPCFPKPFNSRKNIEISFIGNNTLISNTICNYINYINEYIFDGGR
eukprot:554121_1